MATRRLSLAVAISVAGLAFLVYLNALGNGFAVDDVPIIARNPFVHGHGGLRGILLESYWPFARDLYRPLVTLTFAAEWRLSGGSPFWFHLVNLLLHSAVTVLVYALIRRLGGGVVAAGVGAAVFAVHPVHVEAVANVVGRAEILATLYFLAACLLYLREELPLGFRAGGVAVCYFLALAAKEIAVSLPAALLMLDLFLRREATLRAAWSSVRSKLSVHVGAAVALAAYLGLRAHVLGSARGTGQAAYFDEVSTVDRLATAVRLWPEFARLLFWPRDLAWEWGPAVISPTSWGDPLVYAGLVLGTGVIGLAVVAWRRQPWITLAVGWFALTIFLVSQIPFPIGVMMAERHFYLPSVAVSLLAPALVAALRPRAASTRYAAAGALLVLIALGAWRTWQRNPSWESTVTAYMTLGKEHPASFRAAWFAATMMQRVGRLEDALPLYRRAAELMANRYYTLNVEYAHALMSAGRNEAADTVLRRSIEVAPEGSRAYLFLSQSLMDRERFPEAVDVLRTGLATAVDSAEYAVAFTHHLALAYDGAGQLDSALAWRRRGLAEEHDRPFYQEWLHLARLGSLLGDVRLAGAALDSARLVAPDSIRPLLVLDPLPHLRSPLLSGREELVSETEM